MLVDFLQQFRDFAIGPNLDEKRSIPRALCRIPISVQTKSGATVCTLLDLSQKGARVGTDQKFSKNEEVLLLPPKGSGEQDKPAKCLVLWTRKLDGEVQAGLQFKGGRPEPWVKEILRELGLSLSVPRQRRKFVRFHSQISAKCKFASGDKTVKIIDVSYGGALVSSPTKPSPGARVQLYLPACGSNPKLNISCAVVQSRIAGSGGHQISLKFENPTESQRKLLVKHLKYYFRRRLL